MSKMLGHSTPIETILLFDTNHYDSSFFMDVFTALKVRQLLHGGVCYSDRSKRNHYAL